jgi:hypothetical protein
MKKIITILLIILIGLSISCTKPVNTTETVILTEKVTVTSIVEDTKRIDELEIQLKQYQTLLSKLNDLLENVYKGNAKNSNWTAGEFTAFSLEYKSKFYLITAGHCAHYRYENIDTKVFTDFKFKANFSNEWIYPKLLAYENDFKSNKDYAILYSDKVTKGLDFDPINSLPKYILGNENDSIFKTFNMVSLSDGESGSPVINIDGEVTDIATGNLTDIDLILEAIDNLK